MNWLEFSGTLNPEEGPERKAMVLQQMGRILNLAILEWDDGVIHDYVTDFLKELRSQEEWEVIP